MKKILIQLRHNTLFGIIIGGIIFGAIGVSAVTYLYKSDQVSYGNSDVKSALNELYDSLNFDNAIESLTQTGTYATSVTGTINIPSDVRNGILIATFVGVNAIYTSSSISLSNGGTAVKIFQGTRDVNGTNMIAYKISGTGNEEITHTFVHETTGGGVAVMRLLFLY